MLFHLSFLENINCSFNIIVGIGNFMNTLIKIFQITTEMVEKILNTFWSFLVIMV